MPTRSVLAEIARDMLARDGIAAIWKLHLDAATLYRAGNRTSAAVFFERADLATEEWQHREVATEDRHRLTCR
jgi:hypothetical protein